MTKLNGGALSATCPTILIPKTTPLARRWQRVLTFELKPPKLCRLRFRVYADSTPSQHQKADVSSEVNKSFVSTPSQHQNDELSSGVHGLMSVEVRSPFLSGNMFSTPKLSLNDQAVLLLTFIACTTSAAFMGLVFAAVPTLFAMRRAALSLSRLADTAREELPSTMAAIRLSGMEISDLTLELSDLSQEITEGVSKSAQAVQAAEAGIRQLGSIAHQQTMSMIQERASLPVVSLKPMVAGAAKKTSRAVGKATKSLLNMISRGDSNSDVEEGSSLNQIES